MQRCVFKSRASNATVTYYLNDSIQSIFCNFQDTPSSQTHPPTALSSFSFVTSSLLIPAETVTEKTIISVTTDTTSAVQIVSDEFNKNNLMQTAVSITQKTDKPFEKLTTSATHHSTVTAAPKKRFLTTTKVAATTIKWRSIASKKRQTVTASSTKSRLTTTATPKKFLSTTRKVAAVRSTTTKQRSTATAAIKLCSTATVAPATTVTRLQTTSTTSSIKATNVSHNGSVDVFFQWHLRRTDYLPFLICSYVFSLFNLS